MDKKSVGLADFMKDFEIKIDDAALRDRLAKILCAEVKNSIKGNADAYKLFAECEYSYRGMSWWKQNSKTKNQPWLDACDFWAPLTEWIVCAIAARVDSTLFSVEPMMNANAVESGDVAAAPEITNFSDVVMSEIVQLREPFKFYLKQKIKQPLAVAAYEWGYEEEKIREVEQGVVQQDFSVKLTSGQIVPATELPKDIQEEIKNGELQPGAPAYWYVERDKAVLNQAVFKYLSPKDYVWTPGTLKNEKPFLEGYRFWQTIGQIRKRQKNEEYGKYEEIETKLTATINSKVQDADATKRVIGERSHQFECFRLFTRLPFDEKGELALDDPEAVEQEVIAEVAHKEEVLFKIHKWHYLRYPHKKRVFLHGWYEEKDTILNDPPFLGRSMIEKVSEINKLINKEFQQIVDNADLAMCKIFAMRRQRNSEDWEEPEVFPGAFWELDDVNDIKALNMGDVKSIGFQIMNQLMDFAVRISNISSFNVGTRPQGGKPLATEVVNILKEGQVGREGFLQSCHEDLRTVYKWNADYYFQFMPDGLEARIRGEGQQLMFPQAPKEEEFSGEGGQVDQGAYKKALEDFEKKKYYNREMLVGVGKWDFKWNGTQLSGDREWEIQVADYLAEVLPGFLKGGLVTYTGVWELLRDILVSRGKKDWQKYICRREKMEQADQQIDAMDQLKTNLPQIRQKLIEQGMDPLMVSKVIGNLQAKLAGGEETDVQPAKKNKPRPKAAQGQA